MKKLLLFLFAFISITFYAQLDREHWFAPMMDRANTGFSNQRLYMSTGESVPFQVEVYSNNVLIGSVTISKGSPQKFNLNRSDIITTDQSDLFVPITKGIYLKGEKPFFASLRFSMNNHAEILTSKGTAGIGKEFRAVMAPITAFNRILNFMTSVMATEDNTVVTITDFDPTLAFSDGIARTQIDFTLNKGQSYIVDGTGDNYNNHTGFIGSKITANKPVSITNGNFNGQYATASANSSDILMDQGVPVDKLGQEFVLMKGNGTTSSGMEKAIIVATENNTEIYLNNDTTPVAVKNAGEYYETDNFAYNLQGSDHYNMRIKTNKNVYVYQLLAGNSGGSMVATGGFNYIPPLSCYLPKKIDEIGLIDENRVFIGSNGFYSENIPTKLNIITERGATVDVKQNGASINLTALNGPFDVSGNAGWVTYSIPGITGNVSISSSNAVTAGISAGDGAVGYGGYFAGFSSIPLITKVTGECLPGVTLSLTEGFTKYQWLLKSGNSYIAIAGATQNTFNPTQAGIYAVKIQQGSCPEIQTQDYKFFNCTSFTNYNYDVCNQQVITPVFALSTQTVNAATIKINTAPTKGTVTISANGQITYVANAGASGTDYFTYSFCGNDSLPDCETVQATINIRKINNTDATLKACSSTGTASFNLPLAIITNEADITKKYFSDAGLTNEIPTAQVSSYMSAEGVVYVKLGNSLGCEETATIALKIIPPPVVTPSLYTKIHCDEDLDGLIDGNYKVDVNTITPLIVQNPNNFTIRYYADEDQAKTGG
ncbi:MAG: Ig-like domain-containing protein, partial [Kaistella sp.]